MGIKQQTNGVREARCPRSRGNCWYARHSLNHSFLSKAQAVQKLVDFAQAWLLPVNFSFYRPTNRKLARTWNQYALPHVQILTRRSTCSSQRSRIAVKRAKSNLPSTLRPAELYKGGDARPRVQRQDVGEVHGREFNSLFTTSTTHYIPLFGLVDKAILAVMHPGLTLFAWSFSSKMNVCCETEGFGIFIRAARSTCECVLGITSYIETPITTALKLFELPHSRSTRTYSKRPPRSFQWLGTRRPTEIPPQNL